MREVQKLGKNEIQQVKAMKNPPQAVKTVMEAVCFLFGKQPTKTADPDNPGRKREDYWPVSLALLSQVKPHPARLEWRTPSVVQQHKIMCASCRLSFYAQSILGTVPGCVPTL